MIDHALRKRKVTCAQSLLEIVARLGESRVGLTAGDMESAVETPIAHAHEGLHATERWQLHVEPRAPHGLRAEGRVRRSMLAGVTGFLELEHALLTRPQQALQHQPMRFVCLELL